MASQGGEYIRTFSHPPSPSPSIMIVILKWARTFHTYVVSLLSQHLTVLPPSALYVNRQSLFDACTRVQGPDRDLSGRGASRALPSRPCRPSAASRLTREGEILKSAGMTQAHYMIGVYANPSAAPNSRLLYAPSCLLGCWTCDSLLTDRLTQHANCIIVCELTRNHACSIC